MAEVGSAGAISAAILQTAGLASQEAILTSFHSFFQSFGAIIYVVAGIGAVFSVVALGSYRMARYLLLGPALFWFLVGTTVDSPGVTFSSGENRPGFQLDQASPRSTALASSNVVSGSGVGGTDGAPFTVSMPSNWFTTTIDGITKEIVDAILFYENDKDLIFVAKTQAFDFLNNAKITNSDTLEMMTGAFMGGCEQMLSASVALGSSYLDNRDLNLLDYTRTRTQNVQEAHNLTAAIHASNRSRLHYLNMYEAGKALKFSPNHAFIRFIDKFKSVDGPAKLPIEKYGNRLMTQEGAQRADSVITCEEGWQVLTQSVLHEARSQYAQLKESFTELSASPSDNAAFARELCRAIAGKLGQAGNLSYRDISAPEQGDQCNLVPLFAMFMIRNSLSSEDVQESFIQQQLVSASFIDRSKPEEEFVADDQFTGQWELDGIYGVSHRLKWSTEKNRAELRFFKFGDEQCKALRAAHSLDSEEQKDAHPECFKYLPFRRTHPVRNQFDLAFGEAQSYQARYYRQQIFTFALQLPYTQGVVLYLLSVAFPFCALLVISPGHASSFMYLPLAWIWIRSWDVGFALVRVLDKVLWNLFPHTDILPGAIPGEFREMPQMNSLVSEAMKVDPTYHIYSYYFMMSIALLSIPEITAYATLRAKRAVLASFTRSAEMMAGEVAPSGPAQLGFEVNQNFGRAINQAQEAVIAGNTVRLAGVDDAAGNSRRALVQTASAFGLKTLANAAEKASNSGELSAVYSSLIKQTPEAAQTYASLFEATQKYPAAHAAMFDERVGSTSTTVANWRSGQASNEGVGGSSNKFAGFELNDQIGPNDPVASYIDLIRKETDVKLSAARETQTSFAAAIADAASTVLPEHVRKAVGSAATGASTVANATDRSGLIEDGDVTRHLQAQIDQHFRSNVGEEHGSSFLIKPEEASE